MINIYNSLKTDYRDNSVMDLQHKKMCNILQITTVRKLKKVSHEFKLDAHLLNGVYNISATIAQHNAAFLKKHSKILNEEFNNLLSKHNISRDSIIDISVEGGFCKDDFENNCVTIRITVYV